MSICSYQTLKRRQSVRWWWSRIYLSTRRLTTMLFEKSSAVWNIRINNKAIFAWNKIFNFLWNTIQSSSTRKPNKRQQIDELLLVELSRTTYWLLLYFKRCWIFSRVYFSFDDAVDSWSTKIRRWWLFYRTCWHELIRDKWW